MLLSSIPRVRARQPRSAGIDVVLSTHALEQFCARSSRGLTHKAATEQLAGMWEHVEFTRARPDWMRDCRDDNELYAVIADVVFPLRAIEEEPNTWIACTTVFRGERPRRRNRRPLAPQKLKRRKHRRVQGRGDALSVQLRRTLPDVEGDF